MCARHSSPLRGTFTWPSVPIVSHDTPVVSPIQRCHTIPHVYLTVPTRLARSPGVALSRGVNQTRLFPQGPGPFALGCFKSTGLSVFVLRLINISWLSLGSKAAVCRGAGDRSSSWKHKPFRRTAIFRQTFLAIISNLGKCRLRILKWWTFNKWLLTVWLQFLFHLLELDNTYLAFQKTKQYYLPKLLYLLNFLTIHVLTLGKRR